MGGAPQVKCKDLRVWVEKNYIYRPISIILYAKLSFILMILQITYELILFITFIVKKLVKVCYIK